MSPSDLFVAKSATSAFADPSSAILSLTPDLVASWSAKVHTLEEWSKLFMLVKTSAVDGEGPTSAANLEAKEIFAQRAQIHRTPAKRKASIK